MALGASSRGAVVPRNGLSHSAQWTRVNLSPTPVWLSLTGNVQTAAHCCRDTRIQMRKARVGSSLGPKPPIKPTDSSDSRLRAYESGMRYVSRSALVVQRPLG